MEEKTARANQIGKNVMISVFAQAVSLLISLISGFFIPKYIDEYQYAYREIYTLYVSYASILSLGLTDGLLVRYSKYDYDQLDQPRLRSQFKLLLFMVGGISVVSIFVALFFLPETTKQIVVLLAIGALTKNLVAYNSNCFQMSNRINEYAKLVFIQRIAYGVCIVALLLCGVNDFEWYCIASILGDVVVILLSLKTNRALCIGKGLPIKESLRECKMNTSIGAIVLLSSISNSLVLGITKMVIQWRWDELVFGKVSFAFSVTSLFFTFITAISVVLFPVLQRMKDEHLPNVYKQLRGMISLLLFILLIAYFPCRLILEKLIPKYAISLVYLGVLLPKIVFTAKTGLLTDNYLKTYRKEKSMLLVNVVSIVVSLALSVVGAYIFNDLMLVLVFSLVVTMFNSILSECIVARIIKVNLLKEFLLEAVMTVVFIVSVNYLSFWEAFVVYIIALSLYCVIERRYLKLIFERICGKIICRKH